MKRTLQRRPGDEMINEFIVTQIREMMAEARAGVCNGKLRIYATNRETGRRDRLSDADLSGQPSVPGIMMNNLGRYKDVTFERVEEPAEEAPAAVLEAGPDAISEPESETKAEDVQQQTESLEPATCGPG